MDEQVVYDTPWFQIVAKRPAGWERPHYSVRTADYVCVVAADPRLGIALVRQYRPAVGATMLELPSGHVDPGESPEESARRELREEAGFEAGSLEPLGELRPDVGRLGNRMWCFHATGLRRAPGWEREAGVEPVVYGGPLRELLREPDFTHALQMAPLLLALERGLIGWEEWAAVDFVRGCR
jgi:8-oxo-dGTP pyrophosphatase MutT (NUDIX family)